MAQLLPDLFQDTVHNVKRLNPLLVQMKYKGWEEIVVKFLFYFFALVANSVNKNRTGDIIEGAIWNIYLLFFPFFLFSVCLQSIILQKLY